MCSGKNQDYDQMFLANGSDNSKLVYWKKTKMKSMSLNNELYLVGKNMAVMHCEERMSGREGEKMQAMILPEFELVRRYLRVQLQKHSMVTALL